MLTDLSFFVIICLARRQDTVTIDGMRIPRPKVDKLACQAQGESIFISDEIPHNRTPQKWCLFLFWWLVAGIFPSAVRRSVRHKVRFFHRGVFSVLLPPPPH